MQYYVADFTCSCDYFAVFIYGEVVVCCVECAGAAYKERHNSVFCHSTYGQAVFGVQCIGLNIVYINVFVQLNLNFSAVMAYADVLVTAEVHIIAGFYVGCFGSKTVGSQVPACISSVAYFFQLAYVYCVGIFSACCYTGNLAACYIQATADGCSVFAKHDGFCTIISTDIAHANTAVSNCKVFITIGNDDAIFIQVNFGISIGNRGNISQIACNINLVISLAVFNCRFNCCILTVRQGSMFTCFCFYIFQLTIVYCISIGSTCCYTGNLATFFNDNIINLNLAAICKANATCTFTCADDGFDILQLIVQLYFYFSAVTAYADVLVAAEINIFAGSYIGCFGCNTIGGKIPAFICICSYLFDFFQLAYIYSISIINACSYIADYFIVSIQTALGNVSFTAKANAHIIIHEEVTSMNAVNIKISVQFNINKGSKIGFFPAYGNIFIVTAEVNGSTGFNFSRVGDFFPGGKIPACIFSCSLQLLFGSSLTGSCKAIVVNTCISQASNCANSTINSHRITSTDVYCISKFHFIIGYVAIFLYRIYNEVSIAGNFCSFGINSINGMSIICSLRSNRSDISSGFYLSLSFFYSLIYIAANIYTAFNLLVISIS